MIYYQTHHSTYFDILLFSLFIVPPSIDSDSVSPNRSTVVKDNSLYIDCPVTGIPRPKVFW